MAVDVYESLKNLVDQIMGDRDAALQYAQDPQGTLAEHGITEGDLSQVDIHQLVAECAQGHELPYSTEQALQSYTSGGSGPSYPVATPPAAHTSASEVVQHLNYVTYATYEGDEQITQQLISYEDYSTNIDNSVDVDVDGDVHGDFDLETTNVNATGDGAVAAGDDVENAATGDGSQIIDGDNFGQANTGDGVVQAGDDVENAVVGDDNQTAQVSGEADNSVFAFGSGNEITNFGDAEFDDAAVSVGGGEATNVSDNELDEGAAISGTGDASGSFQETEVETDIETDIEIDVQETDIDAEESVVTATVEEGPGDLEDTEVDQEEATAGA